MLRTQLEGVKYSRKIAEIEYDQGAINKLFKYFKKDDYDNYIKTLDLIEGRVGDYIEFINVTQYNNYMEYLSESKAAADGIYTSTGIDISPEPVNITNSEYNSIAALIKSVSDSYYGMDFSKSQTLTSDIEIFNDVEISADVDMNGYTLTIRGDLRQTDGIMKINNGTLNVHGDYKIQKIPTTGVTADSDGVLRMVNKADSVNVGGDFVMQSNMSCYSGWEYYNRFSAGTMTIGGDFYQYNGDSSNFQSLKDQSHVVIIKGVGTHNLHFDSTGSYFSNLKTEDDAAINFTDEFSGFKLCQDLTIDGNTKLTSSTLDLNGYTLTVNGDFDVSSSLKINKGHLIVNGNLTVNSGIDCESGTIDVKQDMTQNTGIDINSGVINVSGNLRHTDGITKINKGTLNVDGDYKIQKISTIGVTFDSDGVLRMVNVADTVNVGGDFVMQSNMSCYSGWEYYNRFSAGTMTIGGDFYQYNGDSGNFQPGPDHMVILNGDKPQKVYFESTSSYINVLVLMNPKSN